VIIIHVSFRNPVTEDWEEIHKVNLIPISELYSDSSLEDDIFGINDSNFTLPNGEEFEVSATFTSNNMGVVIIVTGQDKTLIHVTCYKQSLEGFDPSILFLTPRGANVSIMANTTS